MGLTTGLVGPQSAAGNSGVRLILEPTGTRPADSLFKLAYAEHMRSNLDVARDLYEKAIQTREAPAEAFNDYGALLVQLGNHVAAAEMFRQAIKRDDKNVEAWINLGDSHKMSGHHADAMSAYVRANQLDPTRATVKTRLAGEYLAIGDTATARRIFEDAVKTSPNDPSARYAYGEFLQMYGDYRGAIREFELFVDLATGKFAPDFITDIKRHIVSLRRVAP
jgi:tetratricopeptide (TPR) repeat protein